MLLNSPSVIHHVPKTRLNIEPFLKYFKPEGYKIATLYNVPVPRIITISAHTAF